MFYFCIFLENIITKDRIMSKPRVLFFLSVDLEQKYNDHEQFPLDVKNFIDTTHCWFEIVQTTFHPSRFIKEIAEHKPFLLHFQGIEM